MTRFALALMPLLAVAQPAAATIPDCMPVASILAFYEAEYDETAHWVGMIGTTGEALLILTHGNGGWSMFKGTAERSCLISFGLTNTSIPKANV